jgi:glucan phosphorylase
MKESIRTLAPQFSTRRMVKEYMENLYLPALQNSSLSEKIQESSDGSLPIS